MVPIPRLTMSVCRCRGAPRRMCSPFKLIESDLDDIAVDLASLAESDSLFAVSAIEKLERLQDELRPLAERYDVVLANPPYMGSSSLGKWMGMWVKKQFPEAYRDLCTSFIDRGFTLCSERGYSAMVTMQSWMFLGSYEKLRGKILRNHTISSMAHLGTRAFGAIAGEVVSTTATVFANEKYDTAGTYLRLVDMRFEQEKSAGALEALADSDCGWCYNCSAKAFSAIPGNPIAYWASHSTLAHFENNETLAEHGRFLNGMSTGKNEAVVRFWSEVSISNISFSSDCHETFADTKVKYAPYNKGGEYRKWYGNQWDILAYDEGTNKYMDTLVGHRHNNPDTYFKQCLSWSKISSGKLAMRMFPQGFIYDVAGCSLFLNDPTESLFVLALFNSSVEMRYLEFLAPTLNFEAGQIRKTPYVCEESRFDEVTSLSSENVQLSKTDWDSFEESWNYRRHPLV